MLTDRQTGYPSVDKPWKKYYTKEDHYMLSPDMSMYDFLFSNNRGSLDNTALNYFGKKISYRQLFERIDKVASSLEGWGICEGDVVSICPLNTPEFIYLFYAVNKIGAVSNLIGLTSPVSDLHDELAATDSRIVFTVSLAYEQISEAAKDTKVEKIITVPIEASMPTVLRAMLGLKNLRANKSGVKWNEFIKRSGYKAERAKKPEDVSIIMYTGGSTGIPKGVMLNDRALNSYYINFNASNVNGISCFKKEDSFLDCVPLFLAFGISSCCHGPLCHGMELILTPDPSPDACADTVLKYKPNHVVAGPPLVEALSKKAAARNQDLSFIKSIMYGGETANRQWEIKHEQILQASNFNAKIRNGYGMTETAAAMLIGAGDLPGLVPLCNVGVMVTDPDNCDKELGYDEEGELLLTSDTLMMGYFNCKEESDEVLVYKGDTRWIRTSDLAQISRDGTVKITGRIKRIYYNLDPDNVPLRIYPMRIENVIEGVPGVEKCAAVGIKDPVTAYRTIAYVILSGRSEDSNSAKEKIEAECRRSLPNNHWPDEYVFVEALPVTRAGKVDYRTLEKMAADGRTEHIN